MTEFEIVPAPLDLKPKIEELSRAIYEEHRARQPFAFPRNGFDVTVQPIIDMAFQGAAGEETVSRSAFVAMSGEDFAGYVILSPWIRPGGPEMPYVSIDDIAVVPEFRGRGVGRALLGHVDEIARHRDWDSLTANVWAGNSASEALFAKAGFAPVSTRYRKGPARQSRDYPVPKQEGGVESRRLHPFMIFLLLAAMIALLLQIAW